MTSFRRFARDFPCPVCAGGDDMPRGQGIRCSGFLSADGWAHCSREEHARGLTAEGCGTFAHRLNAPCRCGIDHQTGGPAMPPIPAAPAREVKRATVIGTTRFEVKDAEGTSQAVHVRQDLSDGSKRMTWARPDGSKGLAGRRVDSLPLYRSEHLAAAPAGAPVIVTEGERKADRLAALSGGIAVLGTVTGANGTPDDAALKPLIGRRVFLWPDNDAVGREHMSRIAATMVRLGNTSPRVIEWTDAGPAEDAGDWLDKGGNPPGLKALAEAAKPWVPAPDAPILRTGGTQYVATDAGTFRRKNTRDGEVLEPLSNFAAKIVGEVSEDDGAEVRRLYEIEATMRGFTRRVTVGASHFALMNWVGEALGAGAIVSPGFGAKDHLRCAIQTLSGPEIPRRVRYSHLGWRVIDGRMVYLHGGGAISADGSVSGIEVSLTGALAKYTLPPPPEDDALRQAIRSSLGVLDVAPDEIGMPMFCGVWRAVLGPVDFALHVSGGTGRGKSEHAALLQQHFGAGMTRANLPLSWSSTANALEGTAFGAADALLTVDDFAPSGGVHDVTALHRVAERLIRNTGNGAGRSRMNADGTLKPVRPPRCLIVSTGEDVPRGASIRARMLILEHPGVDFAKLTRCQADAAAGLYALAMSGFLRWLAPRIADLRRDLPRRLAELRTRAAKSGQHRRTPGLVADLAFGLNTFAEFCLDVGASTAVEADALRDRAWIALGKAAQAQAEYQAAADPVRRYLELLGSAVASGRAHVASLSGDSPGPGWGWRDGSPNGDRIGWLDGNELLLEPNAAFAAAQKMASGGGDTIAVSEATLRRRLHERGYLATVEHEGTETRLAPRRTVEGRRQRVLVLLKDSLSSHQPGQPGQRDVTPWHNGPERGPVNGPETETGPQTGPQTGPTPQGLAEEWPGWPGRRKEGGAVGQLIADPISSTEGEV